MNSNPREYPREKLNRMIDNLELSADAKEFIASLMDKTLRVGSVVLKIGKKIVEIMIAIVNQFPNTTGGLVLAVIISSLVSSIPLLGPLLATSVALILVTFGLKNDFMDQWRNQAIDRKIGEAIRPLEVLKGTD